MRNSCVFNLKLVVFLMLETVWLLHKQNSSFASWVQVETRRLSCINNMQNWESEWPIEELEELAYLRIYCLGYKRFGKFWFKLQYDETSSGEKLPSYEEKAPDPLSATRSMLKRETWAWREKTKVDGQGSVVNLVPILGVGGSPRLGTNGN